MRIEIDTRQLSADIKTVEDRKNALSEARGQVFRCMEQVNAMWEGEAHDRFLRQMAADDRMLLELQGNIENLIECMKFARNEYDKCTDTVADKIAQIRLSSDR